MKSYKRGTGSNCLSLKVKRETNFIPFPFKRIVPHEHVFSLNNKPLFKALNKALK